MSSSDTFIIQSHRGAGILAPENTLGAFERGWALGTYPEADLRTTRDGVIVALHDQDLRRVLGLAAEEPSRPASELTWAELSEVSRGTVPRLREILDRMQGRPERHFYLDIKDVDLPQLASEVSRSGCERQVILASPKPEEVRTWSELTEGGETLLWMGGEEATLRERLDALRLTGFAGITQLQVHVRLREGRLVDPDPFAPSADFIHTLGVELRERGILFQALPWSADDPAVYTWLMHLGVQSFATDYPEAALAAIRQWQETHWTHDPGPE